MKKIFAFCCICLVFGGFACNCANEAKNENEFETLIKKDLIKLFEKKIDVLEINIEEVNDYKNTARPDVVIMFGCSLKFTDDFYGKNGTLKYVKGMTLHPNRIFFTYTKVGNNWQLTKATSLELN